jgi:plasmid stabilization system protein ParE
MALTIYWSRRASQNFISIINYLLENWGVKSVQNFVREIDLFFTIVITNPEIGRIIVKQEYIRSFVVVKHITVIYKLQGDEIVLMNIFDNRQNPKKRF